jgi:hypothetical protein
LVFNAVVQEHLPYLAIVFDYYHLSDLISKAIDDLRENNNPNWMKMRKI